MSQSNQHLFTYIYERMDGSRSKIAASHKNAKEFLDNLYAAKKIKAGYRAASPREVASFLRGETNL